MALAQCNQIDFLTVLEYTNRLFLLGKIQVKHLFQFHIVFCKHFFIIF